jgi:hypothetical protein
MLIRFPRPTARPESEPRGEEDDDDDEVSVPLVQPSPMNPAFVRTSLPSTVRRYARNGEEPSQDDLQSTQNVDSERHMIPKESSDVPARYVLPLASVFVSSSVGLLAFMVVNKGGPTEVPYSHLPRSF